MCLTDLVLFSQNSILEKPVGYFLAKSTFKIS